MYRCLSVSEAPSAGSYKPPTTGTGTFPGMTVSKVAGLTICLTESFVISSLQRKVKSTPVTSDATGFEMFIVFDNAQKAQLRVIGGGCLTGVGQCSC